MADTTVDKVKIEIEASAKKAGDSIDKLIEMLGKLKDTTGNIDTDRLTALNNSIANLSESMKNLPKASAFERLARGIERLSQIDTSGISAVTGAIDDLANSVSALNASGINDVRLNVGADRITATDMSGDTAADMQQLADASNEAGDAMDNMRDSMNETADSEERAGDSSTSLAERLAALQAKWRDIEDSFSARDIIGGAIYKMNSAVINGFSNMVSGAKSAFGKLRDTVSSAAQNVVATIRTIPANLQYAAENMKASLSNAGASIKDAFTHPISTAIGGLRSLVEAAGRVRGALGNINIGGVSGALLRIGQIAGGIVKNGLHACASAMNKVAGAAKVFISKVASVTKGVLKMAAAFQKNHGMFGKFSSAVKKCGTVLQGLSHKLKSVTRLLTFMLLRKAITAMFKSLGDAFQHLALKSASVNEQMSALVSACSYFSHQVAALASPLLDIFGPALTKIINLLATATSYINQFLSALTGKKFYTSAKKQNIDYAASLDDTGKAAKKAAKEIRDATVGIDELNIISQNDDNGSGSGGADDLEDCYEELAINQKILDIVQKLKDLLAELFQPMKQAWDDYGQGVIDAFQYALSSCKKLIVDMAKTWKDVWLNGSGYELCSNILLLLTSMLNWIGDIATAWDAAWQVKGYDYVQSVFDKLNAVLSLIYTISESFRKAFNSGSGQEMIEHIYQIFTDINYVVANLANGFKKAWQEAGTGDAIAQAIFDIINSILRTIEKITGSTREWAKNLNLSPLLTSIKNLLEKVKPLVDKIGDALSWAWENILLPLGKWAVESALPKVIDAIAAAFDALNSILEALKPVFKWIWDHMLEPLAKWTGGTIVEIIEGITSVFEGISEVFKKIADGEDWGEIGRYIWEGLINGIKNVGSWIWEKLTDAFWGIVDFVKDLFGIHSPSTVFEDIGKNIIDGFINGIKNFASSCIEPIKNWANGVIDWFTGGDGQGNIVEKFKTFGGNIVSGFREKVGSTYSTVKTNVTSWASGVKEWFYGNGVTLKENFTEYANNAITGFREKIGNTYSTVKTNVTTWASKVKDWYTNSGFGGINKDTFSTYANNIISGFREKVGSTYTTVKNNITTWADKVKAWYTDSGFGGVNSNTFTKYATNIIDGFKTKVGNYYGTVKSNITTWASKVKTWFTDDGGVNATKFTSFATNIIDGFKTRVGNYYSTAKSNISTWASKVKSWFTDDGGVNNSKFQTFAANIIDGFKTKVGSYYSTAQSNITTWATKCVDWFKEKSGKSSWESVATDVVDGFKNKIGSLYSTCKNTIQSWGSSIISWFKEKLDINSPSKVFEQLAEYTVQGYSDGISNNGENNTKGPIVAFADSIKKWFTDSGFGNINKGTWETYAGDIVNSFNAKVGNTYATVKDNVTTWAAKTKQWFSDNGFGGVNNSTWTTYAGNIISGFRDKVGNFYTATKDGIVTWANKVREWYTSSSYGGVNSNNFQTYANNIITGFKTKIGNTYTTVQGSMTTWANKVREWYTSSSFGGVNSTNFQTYAANVIDGFKSRVGSYYTTAQSNVTTWGNKVRSWFTDNGGANSSNFSTFATNVIDGFKNRIGGYYSTSGSNMTTWGNYVKTTFQNSGMSSSGFYNIASDVVNGFKNGIGALYQTCKSTISSWGSSIISWFKDKLDINSPSRVFKEIGGFTVAGFNAGIDDSGNSTAAHMRDWLAKFSDFQANITAKLNVKEVMDSYTPKYDTGITTESIERTVRQEINAEGRVKASLEDGGGFASAMEEVIDRTISRKLDGIENYTKIQAEKRETTKVYVGDREVAKSVEKQRRDNGFSFTPATT